MCAARAGSRGRVQPGSVAASVLSLLEGGGGSVTATQREQSRLCGRPASSVAASVRRLRDAGAVRVVRRYSKDGAALGNRYEVTDVGRRMLAEAASGGRGEGRGPGSSHVLVASDQMVIVDELALEVHMTKQGVVRMLLAEALEARGMTKGDK